MKDNENLDLVGYENCFSKGIDIEGAYERIYAQLLEPEMDYCEIAL